MTRQILVRAAIVAIIFGLLAMVMTRPMWSPHWTPLLCDVALGDSSSDVRRKCGAGAVTSEYVVDGVASTTITYYSTSSRPPGGGTRFFVLRDDHVVVIHNGGIVGPFKLLIEKKP